MSEPFPLPTDTRALDIESRQYELLGIDLGAGLPRVALKLGAFLYVPWFFLLATLGMPILGAAMVLWILPPTLTLVRGITKDAGGRLRLVAWGDRLSWWIRRHRPIVNGDTTAPAELAPIRVDVAFVPVTLDRPDQPFYDTALDFVSPGVRSDFVDPPRRTPTGAPRGEALPA